MYHWVEDKDFIKRSYSQCAGIVNELVQRLKSYDIDAGMYVVGSKKRNMITQNGEEDIDYDFNLLIRNAKDFSEGELKKTVQIAFNHVLTKHGMENCNDSKSVLTTKTMRLKKGNQTGFKMDICIVSYCDDGQLQRLIHKKTGRDQFDQWYWNKVPNSKDLQEKERKLKPKYWAEVRDVYLVKKNYYLRWQNYYHPSFNCYIEAVNEVYDNRVRYENFSVVNFRR